jgi:transposase
MSYPLKFREKVLKIKKEENLTLEEASKRFYIGTTTISRWQIKIEPCLTRNRPAIKIDMEKLKQDIKNEPDAYQRERATRLGVSPNTVLYAIRRLKISYKKNSFSS